MADYGWSPLYPLEALTVSATASRKGLSNQPTSYEHQHNLSLLSDFLGQIPFSITITSAYRSQDVNKAVGGSATSQHPNGLAVDFAPNVTFANNQDVATWFYMYQDKFPELDQVIWYEDTTHVHVGICPEGAIGCVRGAPRHQFLRAIKKKGKYYSWRPTEEDLARVYRLLPPPRQPSKKDNKTNEIAKTLAFTTLAVGVGVVVLAIVARAA